MNFTNTDSFWNEEVIINIKVIDQVCQEVRIKLFSRLPQYFETPSFLIRLKIEQEINK